MTKNNNPLRTKGCQDAAWFSGLIKKRTRKTTEHRDNSASHTFVIFLTCHCHIRMLLNNHGRGGSADQQSDAWHVRASDCYYFLQKSHKSDQGAFCSHSILLAQLTIDVCLEHVPDKCVRFSDEKMLKFRGLEHFEPLRMNENALASCEVSSTHYDTPACEKDPSSSSHRHAAPPIIVANHHSNACRRRTITLNVM